MVAEATTCIEPAMDTLDKIVTVDKISTVVPATPTDEALRGPMFLTSCDLVCRSYPYINRIFFFELPAAGYGELGAKPVVTYDTVVASLRAGLADALVVFYPLAGRFTNDADGRLQVDVNDRGVEFVEASVDTAFSELRSDGFQYRNLFWKLARRTHLLRSDYLHLPILSVQVTKFADGGGIAVGVSLSHAVADAQSFYDFVRTWSEMSRGAPATLDIRHMRTALSVGSLRHVANDVAIDDLVARMKKSAVVNDEHVAAAEVNGKLDNDMVVMRKKGEHVAENNGKLENDIPVMKKKAENVAGDSEQKSSLAKMNGKLENDARITRTKETNEGINVIPLPAANGVAPRGKAPIMEKQLELEEHRKPRTDLVQKVFSFTYEMLQKLKERAAAAGKSYTTFESFCAHWWQSLIRARDLPDGQNVFLLIPINCRKRFLGLPEGYFGNSLDGGLVRMTAGELRQASLPEIAAKIHAAITAVTEDSFREYILQAEARRNAIPHFDRTGLFHVVDSPKYPVYDTDFGFGRPAAVRAEGFRFGAEVQILAGRLGLGSFDMFCALDGATMNRLELDPHFLAC